MSEFTTPGGLRGTFSGDTGGVTASWTCDRFRVERSRSVFRQHGGQLHFGLASFDLWIAHPTTTLGSKRWEKIASNLNYGDLETLRSVLLAAHTGEGEKSEEP